MIYSGIDEAGLGPVLGPFCVTRVTMESLNSIESVTDQFQKDLFYVADSKVVHKGKNGFRTLELNVLSFYYLLYKTLPINTLDFMPNLKNNWYNNPISIPVQVSNNEIREKGNKIGKLFKDYNIKLLDIKQSAVSAKGFNLLLDTWENKAIVCQQIINPLITSSLYFKSQHKLVVDKQGGRKFYGKYLEELINDRVSIIKEVQSHSQYQYKNNQINFMARADSSSFTVSLASMFSKYMRELGMIVFNNYWESKHSKLKGTKGYYIDGMRFINDLKSQKMLPMNLDELIRKK